MPRVGSSLLSYSALLLLALCSPLAIVQAVFAPVDDVPFREVFAHRFTARGLPAVSGWGVLPFHNISQVLAGSVEGMEGVFTVTEGGLFFLEAPEGQAIYNVVISSVHVGLNARVALGEDGTLGAVAVPEGLFYLQCFLSGSSVVCDSSLLAARDLGTVTGLAAQTWDHSNQSCYVATSLGLLYYTSARRGTLALLWDTPVRSVAYSPALELAAAGNADFVAVFRGTELVNREWVTNLATASGGVYDGPASALVFDGDGLLYAANEVCLNTRFPNATVGRIGYLEGLPYNQTTSLAVEPASHVLWVGTVRGAARYDPASGAWEYYYLQRYLPGSSVVVALSSGSTFTAVATDGGLAFLQTRFWTLAQKAAYYETVQQRHDRVGLVGDCSLSSFGNISSCANHDDDNNGLWTSLVVGAEALRYAATKDPQALTLALHYYEGMRLLNSITGIPGLMARSAVRPGEAHGDGQWHYSTVPEYAGWQWKGDTSSDEVVGHMFAFNIMARLVLTGAERDAAIALLTTIVKYIVKNNFYLIDVTGNHTTWGVWNPENLNNQRFWSDEHGVNSIQILGYLLSAIELSGDPDGSLRAAYNTLTNSSNHFDFNTVNAKILSPDDDNYSDDELTFLPYYTMFTSAGARANPLLLSSLRRTWSLVQPLRSDLWNAIYIAVDGALATQEDADDVAWNLRTWPVELVNWPVQNSHRRDLRFDINADRSGVLYRDSVRVLPANERCQYRWNANPHDLDDNDGGSGFSETDAGAWLLPYWMARFYGIIV